MRNRWGKDLGEQQSRRKMTSTFESRVHDPMPTSGDDRQPRQEFETWNSATVPAWGRIRYLRLPVSVGPSKAGTERPETPS
jgi:hypothetical protein